MHVSKGMLRIFIIYVVIAISVFGYFSWTNHWYKVFEDRYYAYIPVNSFIAICYPCEDVKYLENDSGLLIGFGNDYSQIAKINRYGGEPREIGNPDSKLHIFERLLV